MWERDRVCVCVSPSVWPVMQVHCCCMKRTGECVRERVRERVCEREIVCVSYSLWPVMQVLCCRITHTGECVRECVCECVCVRETECVYVCLLVCGL